MPVRLEDETMDDARLDNENELQPMGVLAGTTATGDYFRATTSAVVVPTNAAYSFLNQLGRRAAGADDIESTYVGRLTPEQARWQLTLTTSSVVGSFMTKPIEHQRLDAVDLARFVYDAGDATGLESLYLTMLQSTYDSLEPSAAYGLASIWDGAVRHGRLARAEGVFGIDEWTGTCLTLSPDELPDLSLLPDIQASTNWFTGAGTRGRTATAGGRPGTRTPGGITPDLTGPIDWLLPGDPGWEWWMAANSARGGIRESSPLGVFGRRIDRARAEGPGATAAAADGAGAPSTASGSAPSSTRSFGHDLMMHGWCVTRGALTELAPTFMLAKGVVRMSLGVMIEHGPPPYAPGGLTGPLMIPESLSQPRVHTIPEVTIVGHPRAATTDHVIEMPTVVITGPVAGDSGTVIELPRYVITSSSSRSAPFAREPVISMPRTVVVGRPGTDDRVTVPEDRWESDTVDGYFGPGVRWEDIRTEPVEVLHGRGVNAFAVALDDRTLRVAGGFPKVAMDGRFLRTGVSNLRRY
jgi:hypothetical protein